MMKRRLASSAAPLAWIESHNNNRKMVDGLRTANSSSSKPLKKRRVEQRAVTDQETDALNALLSIRTNIKQEDNVVTTSITTPPQHHNLMAPATSAATITTTLRRSSVTDDEASLSCCDASSITTASRSSFLSCSLLQDAAGPPPPLNPAFFMPQLPTLGNEQQRQQQQVIQVPGTTATVLQPQLQGYQRLPKLPQGRPLHFAPKVAKHLGTMPSTTKNTTTMLKPINLRLTSKTRPEKESY